ncbi:mechanosensitive ion channel [Candidatus Microgenomates bacterium]|nr:mechanosensitive ion channel [Candidatus Microgenomates bacterium]
MIEKSVRIIIILFSAWFLQLFIKFFIKRLKNIIKKAPLETVSQRKQRVQTLTSLLINTSSLIINTTALLLVFSELGIDILPLLAGVGVLGLAAGFGAKSLVADFITGFFILLENQFNIGDEVNLGGNWQGKVIKVSLRTTTLKDKEGKIYIIPNSAIKAVIKF